MSMTMSWAACLPAAIRRIFVRTLLIWLRERAARAGLAGGRTGAVILAQRFGGALNLNLHFHALVLDGVVTSQKPLAPPSFHEAEPLTDRDVVEVTTTIHRRILRYLRRVGRLPRDEQEESSEAEPDEPLFAELCAASVQGRVALGAQRGAGIEQIGRRRDADRPLSMPGELCCDLERFSLHAKVRIEASDREGLERLCRIPFGTTHWVVPISLRETGAYLSPVP